jgi:hypothetical protein
LCAPKKHPKNWNKERVVGTFADDFFISFIIREMNYFNFPHSQMSFRHISLSFLLHYLYRIHTTASDVCSSESLMTRKKSLASCHMLLRSKTNYAKMMRLKIFLWGINNKFVRNFTWWNENMLLICLELHYNQLFHHERSPSCYYYLLFIFLMLIIISSSVRLGDDANEWERENHLMKIFIVAARKPHSH